MSKIYILRNSSLKQKQKRSMEYLENDHCTKMFVMHIKNMFGGKHKAWSDYMTEEVWNWKGRKRATDLKKLKFKILINQNRIINQVLTS